MTRDGSDLTTLALRLERIADRLDNLEVQVRGLVTSQTVEAKEFGSEEWSGHVRARFEFQEYTPCLTFYDPAGTERLKVGLRTDSSPVVRVEQREIPLG